LENNTPLIEIKIVFRELIVAIYKETPPFVGEELETGNLHLIREHPTIKMIVSTYFDLHNFYNRREEIC
jgi:hypothetical protein